MSRDHLSASDPEPEWPDIPVTTGISTMTRLLLVGSVVVAMLMGSFVIISSDFGRVWPSIDSTKVPLPGGR
jgi:hypothetical protein